MTTKTLIWVLVIWLLSNAIFPFVLNSLERLYQDKIDVAVGRSLRGLRWLLLAACQVVLIAYFAPLILIFAVVERLCPVVLKMKPIQESGVYSALHLVLTARFWSTIATSIRQMRRKNKEGPTAARTVPLPRDGSPSG